MLQLLWKKVLSVIDRFSRKNLETISKWVDSPSIFKIDYKDESKEIVDTLINDYSNLN